MHVALLYSVLTGAMCAVTAQMFGMDVLVSGTLYMSCKEQRLKEAYIQGSAESIQQLPHLQIEHANIHVDINSFALWLDKKIIRH